MLRRVMMEAEEADEVVAQMELELQGHASKAKLQVKLRGYKAELQRRKTEARSLTASLDRHDLLGGPSRSGAADAADDGSGLSQAQAQRARLLAGTDKLSDGQRRLEDSHRIALETESLGTGILGNLRSQREQLENTRDTLHGADSSIGKASDTLQKMLRRSVVGLAPPLSPVAGSDPCTGLRLSASSPSPSSSSSSCSSSSCFGCVCSPRPAHARSPSSASRRRIVQCIPLRSSPA